MDVVRTIKPGDKGSQRFVKKYGERLVAVRYRKKGSHRLTTVELIVEQRLPQKNHGRYRCYRSAQTGSPAYWLCRKGITIKN